MTTTNAQDVETGRAAAETGAASEAKPRRVGFKDVTWHEPGNWIRKESLQYVMERIGQNPDEGTGVLVVRYDPNCEIGVHYHKSDYCSIVVEGSIEISRVKHEVGSMRFVKAGTVYGPLIAGPEGCTVIDVFAVGNDPMSAVNIFVDMEKRRSPSRQPQSAD
jgi:quercetin dioxygenase-like cupin family protein